MPEEIAQPRIVGRSSSHFTRVTRIFAAETHLDYAFDIVRDLMSQNVGDYAGNPALKLPVLQTSGGSWFGALNICRALSRLSTRDLHIVWPEVLHSPLLANAQELVLQAMATEVNLIMSELAQGDSDDPHQTKMRTSLVNMMSWLDANVRAALAELPADRDLSYLEVTLFCLVTHLEFRGVLPVAPYLNLAAFCRFFGARPAARETAYRFD